MSFGKCKSKEANDLSGQAALFFLIKWAKGNGIEYLDYGLCSPFLKDGLFAYKKEWGMSICSRPECFASALKLFSVDEACLSFLQGNPFVVLDGGKLKVVAFLGYKPIAQEIQQILSDYLLSGLESVLAVTCFKKSAAPESPTANLVACRDTRIFNCLSDFCILMSPRGFSTEVFELTKSPAKCRM